MAKTKKVEDVSANEGEVVTLLSTYKKSLKTTARKERPLSYIKFSKTLQSILSVTGFPISNITTIAGDSDTGKTTLLIEGIIEAQKNGILPIILITENKFSFERAKLMGLDCYKTEVVDEETGEVTVDWDGDFIYRNDFISSEEMYEFMAGLCDKIGINDNKKFSLDRNICFFVDSLNKLKCKKAFEKILEGESDLPMHNAKVHSNWLGGILEPMITRTKFTEFPFTASLVGINRMSSGSDSPNMKETGGKAMWYDAGLKILCGGKLSASTREITAQILGKTRKIGSIMKIRVIKNHITGISSEGEIYNCTLGITDKDGFESYKKENLDKLRQFYKDFDNGVNEEDPV